jgi:hypothetical protein
MRRVYAILALAASFLAVSCRDQPMEPVVGPLYVVSDGSQMGDHNPDFFWLPPLVRNPVNHPNFEPGEFNPNLQPHIEVCQLDAPDGYCVEDLILTSDNATELPAPLVAGEEQYKVEWNTSVPGLSAGQVYRIFAFVGTTPVSATLTIIGW